MKKSSKAETKAKLKKPQIAYRTAIVSFIDILGFRELVRRTDPAEIHRIVRLTQKFAKASDELDVKEAKLERDLNWTTTMVFSDSIVRIRPFDARYDDGSLFYELIDLVHAQADLVNHGIFLRGGMTVGKVFFEKDVAYGPAFVRAYDLESQYANVPRIVIGPEVFDELRKNPKLRGRENSLEHEIHYIKKLVRRGEDGLWFIDYLKAIVREMDDPDQKYPPFLQRHKNFIIENAKQAPIESRVMQKYLWLASYHNAVCREFPQAPNASEHEITTQDMPAIELLPERDPNTLD